MELRKRHRPEYRALYKLPQWEPLRQIVFLRDNYTCQWPGCGRLLIGKRNEPNSPVAHHRQDHKGDLALFLDPLNVMAVCKECHDTGAQRAAHRGYVSGHGEDGRPLDPDHPWNRR
ncbi:HNH endonuclease [Pararhizobium gei]|uniref:HNH endonuclease n=1 Tax=Pararhizobium gei TaxID=1395951 RepID=UPI0023DB1AC5|nr:HNH endonuclease [Rhizobium gei]